MGVLAGTLTDFKALRDTTEKVGSKRFLRGKKIEFELLKPYQLISEFRALAEKNPRTDRGLKLDSEKKSLLVECKRLEPLQFFKFKLFWHFSGNSERKTPLYGSFDLFLLFFTHLAILKLKLLYEGVLVSFY